MKQFFCTGGPAGPEVRAATPGATPEQVQAALAHAGCSWPAEPRDGAEPPARLALLQTADAGRVLVHCVPTEGGTFAHVLLDVPASLDAQHATQTWGSPLWQQSDHG